GEGVRSCPRAGCREIRMSGSMRGVWKRSHGRTSEAPPDERGGYRYVRPTATASHLDSTHKGTPPSNDDFLDLIKADLITPGVVELRRARKEVVRHRAVFSNVPSFLR